MVSRKDYSELPVEAARSVLIELTHLLGAYRDDIVLIGGWVPGLLFSESAEAHLGSTDIDLALNHLKLKDEGYKTIQELLLSRGYRQGSQPFIFHREVNIDGQEISVQVDLLSGEYAGTGKSHRHQKIQDVLARKTRGCDLAFEAPVEREVAGTLPGGGKDSVTVRVASIVPFLVMKSIALNERLKEKDAWDIYYCLKNYPGGIDALAEEFKPHLTHLLIKEGLTHLKKNFASESHVGCKFVADFDETADAERAAFLQRDVYERVNRLLEKLGQ